MTTRAISVRDYAREWAISPSTVRRLIADGKLAAKRIATGSRSHWRIFLDTPDTHEAPPWFQDPDAALDHAIQSVPTRGRRSPSCVIPGACPAPAAPGPTKGKL